MCCLSMKFVLLVDGRWIDWVWSGMMSDGDEDRKESRETKQSGSFMSLSTRRSDIEYINLGQVDVAV